MATLSNNPLSEFGQTDFKMLIDDFNDSQNCHFDKLFHEEDQVNYEQKRKKSQLQTSYSFVDFYYNNLINSID